MGTFTRLLVAAALLASQLVTPAPTAAASLAIMIGAGDIASCQSNGDEATAALVARQGGTVFTLGDNAYDRGTGWQFRHCYAHSWGAFLTRTRPAAGNHDFQTTGGDGYFDYFGARAGSRPTGWYAYNRGAWRVYVLNSNCDAVGGCFVGSKQQRWLAADLAAHPHQCVLAYWHHPRFSSGYHGNQKQVRGFWVTLYHAGADVVLNGHDHDYERFALQDPSGRADAARGIREFVVGTGGAERRPMGSPHANSQVRNASTFGVLKLVLRPGTYHWQFLPAGSSSFDDSGSGTCH